jgi:hypothetical protein
MSILLGNTLCFIKKRWRGFESRGGSQNLVLRRGGKDGI